MKWKPTTKSVVEAIIAVLLIVALILVFVSRSFFLDAGTVYGKF